MLSGATGIPLGTRYLEMPNNKESYMSPALYSPPDGSTPYVLFGSGGETVPGFESFLFHVSELIRLPFGFCTQSIGDCNTILSAYTKYI